MLTLRDRPLGSSNFLVEIGGASGRAPGAGFAEVVLPPFVLDAPATGRGAAGPLIRSGVGDGVGATLGGIGVTATPPAARHLVLRRGATGALDLYQWWDLARRGKARRRIVKVKLLADDRSTVAMTWRFSNVRPVSLSYSALNAMASGPLMETLELAFDAVEMS
ncbi:MAG TPA: phage tail protein [Caldimonas sp.]|nr:phage tail protein [Caldimonas sp.]HEX4234379.1 phage tail protein [Caldimonas sp.]